MEIELTEDQELFHQTTARFIEGELPIEATRALHDTPDGFDRSWLRAAAELGWFTMLVPEGDGGGSVSGAGLVDATIIAEEVGRHVQPGPFTPMNVVAAAVAAEGDDGQKADLLPGIMSGQTIATWAFAADDGNWDLGAGCPATPTDGGYRLTGSRGYVQDVGAADVLLVVASVGGKPTQFLVPTDADGLTIVSLETLDLSRRMARVEFEGVPVGGERQLGAVGAEAALERQLQVATALTCADTVGALEALFTMTVEYAKDRVAFGRPIGSFQALKHLLADEAMNLEACKGGAVSLARAVQNLDGNAAEVASMVAAYIGDTADRLSQVCLQVHGGIGYTWEHDLHLLMRRVRTNSVLYGEPTWHRERVCRYHRLGEGD